MRMGHATLSTTLDIYSHVVPGLQEQAARTFAAAMEAAKKDRLSANVGKSNRAKRHDVLHPYFWAELSPKSGRAPTIRCSLEFWWYPWTDSNRRQTV